MAKKMSTGKVVALALCLIVGAGSIAALARGRDKDDEKDKGTGTHVCSFEESNVCSCGERQEEILLSDVKVGMDLSGYALRIAVSKEEFDEIFLRESGDLYDYGLAIFSIYGEGFYIASIGEGIEYGVLDESSGSPATELLIHNDTSTGYVIPNGSIVNNVDFSGDYLDYFEFYYEGLSETAAVLYSMKETTAQADAPANESIFDDILVEDGAESFGEWTTLF